MNVEVKEQEGKQLSAEEQAVEEMFDIIKYAYRYLGEEAVFADAALAGLRPARMVDLGIDVGVEAVFLRCRDIPGRRAWLCRA